MIQTFRENRILSQVYALVVNFCTYVWYCIVSVVSKHAEQKPVEASQFKQAEMKSRTPRPQTWETKRKTYKQTANWTNEDLCAFVQELTEEFGDQASVYAETMKKHKLRGRHLHMLKTRGEGGFDTSKTPARF